MATEIKGNIWTNKCDTYGIASIQLHWGRTAALLVRLLFYTLPTILWAFIYVDDFITTFRHKDMTTTGHTVLRLLITMGCPSSRKRTMLGTINKRLGHQIKTHTSIATLTAQKQTITVAILQAVVDGGTITKTTFSQHGVDFSGAPQSAHTSDLSYNLICTCQRATKLSGRPPRRIRYFEACLVNVYQTIPHPDPLTHTTTTK
jgi:hypothetical protein